MKLIGEFLELIKVRRVDCEGRIVLHVSSVELDGLQRKAIRVVALDGLADIFERFPGFL